MMIDQNGNWRSSACYLFSCELFSSAVRVKYRFGNLISFTFSFVSRTIVPCRFYAQVYYDYFEREERQEFNYRC